MTDGISEAQRANTRLDHINGDLKDIKLTLKEHTTMLGKTNVDMAGLKTEVRLAVGLFLALVAALIGASIGGLI